MIYQICDVMIVLVFVNISFEPYFIKSPNLANL